MNYAERARTIFNQEITELQQVALQIGKEFDEAVAMIYACRGKTVVMGIGKTGTIGHKIASSKPCTGIWA